MEFKKPKVICYDWDNTLEMWKTLGSSMVDADVAFFFINIGLADGYSVVTNGHESDWVSTFWLHFLIICIIQYVLMLVIVTLGIIIPALIAMYRKPVNALRYE